MSDAIEKEPEEHTVNEMRKRDGETNMAVGLFLFALSIPVLLGTFAALERPRAAFVNAICGGVLFFIGAGVIAYGWWEFRKATKKHS